MNELQVGILTAAVLFYGIFMVGPTLVHFVEALRRGHNMRGAAEEAVFTLLIGAYIATAGTALSTLVLVLVGEIGRAHV